jgi:hypothetical protein
MTSSAKLLTRGVLTSLPLFIACSTGKPPSDDDSWATGGTTNGATGGTGASANGGGSATGVGGSGAISMAGSATSGAAGSGAVAATGGDTSAGGTSSMGGMGAVGALGGAAGMGALGGAGGAAASSAMGGMSGTDPGICQDITAKATPTTPTVEILVDTSSSMFETNPTAWVTLYNALDGADGIVKALQDDVNFGFASYKGLKGTSETDPACATMTTVAPGPTNFDAIDAVYKKLGVDDMGVAYSQSHPTPQKWETPTNYAIAYASKLLQAYNPMPPGAKYILLVTDGNPNTCQVTDPQCGQDYAIKAAQDAYAAGIGLFVLGVGDIVINGNSGCTGTGARCGLDHLQDLANAGVGAPVMPATGCEDPGSTSCQERYSSCNQGNMLTATYTAMAPNVGTPFAVDTGASDAQTKLKAALTALLNQAVSCTFELDVTVTGDASKGVVTVGGNAVTYNVADGWVLDADQYHVTLQGGACETYRAGAAANIQFPCDNGNPIAVHR